MDTKPAVLPRGAFPVNEPLPTAGVSLHPNSTTALIVVDVQNDFADPDGSLYVSGGEEIIATVNTLIDATLEAEGMVVYTQDWHPEKTPHFIDEGGVWPVHCVRDTWGAEFHPALRIEGPIVRKGTNGEDGYSGFTMRDPESGEQIATELDSLLEGRGIQRAVIVGLALDVCVKATAEDAVANGYDATIIQDASRAVELTPGDGTRAIDEMLAHGVTVL